MKYSDLKAIFASEQTNRGLLVIGLDHEGRQMEVLFHSRLSRKRIGRRLASGICEGWWVGDRAHLILEAA